MVGVFRFRLKFWLVPTTNLFCLILYPRLKKCNKHLACRILSGEEDLVLDLLDDIDRLDDGLDEADVTEEALEEALEDADVFLLGVKPRSFSFFSSLDECRSQSLKDKYYRV